jgi:ketosteroid isomerase-like protein
MRGFLVALAVIYGGAGGFAQANGGDEVAIRAVMAAQVAAWNKGDVVTFMQSYENSPDTTYTNAAQMGTLTFSNIEVRLLPGSCGAVEYAVITGNFHLDRTQKGAATKDDGIFSLVWHKGPDGWKIVLDHTS